MCQPISITFRVQGWTPDEVRGLNGKIYDKEVANVKDWRVGLNLKVRVRCESFLRWADLGCDLVTLAIEALDGFFGAPLELLRVRELVPQLLGSNRLTIEM